MVCDCGDNVVHQTTQVNHAARYFLIYLVRPQRQEGFVILTGSKPAQLVKVNRCLRVSRGVRPLSHSIEYNCPTRCHQTPLAANNRGALKVLIAFDLAQLDVPIRQSLLQFSPQRTQAIGRRRSRPVKWCKCQFSD